MRNLLPLSLLLTACVPAPVEIDPVREPLTNCTATDGDTIRCGDERIRIIAIQAPDRPTSAPCKRNDPDYVCSLAGYQAAKRAMERIVAGGGLTIERDGEDRYGRTTGHVYAGGVSVACIMMAEDLAAYWERYDEDGRVAEECGL